MDGIDEVERIPDPAERAREVGRRMAAIPEIHARLKHIRQAAVAEMKGKGMSFAEIAAELGLHRNRVQQLLAGRSAGGQGGSRAVAADEIHTATLEITEPEQETPAVQESTDHRPA